jgi:hypothetical protein
MATIHANYFSPTILGSLVNIHTVTFSLLFAGHHQPFEGPNLITVLLSPIDLP